MAKFLFISEQKFFKNDEKNIIKLPHGYAAVLIQLTCMIG